MCDVGVDRIWHLSLIVCIHRQIVSSVCMRCADDLRARKCSVTLACFDVCLSDTVSL